MKKNEERSQGKESETGEKKIKKRTAKKDSSKVQKLQKELEETKTELDNIKEKHLRLLAEFENYKKRRQREILELREYANISFMEELLPVLDDLDRSLNSKNNLSAESFFQGVEMIQRKFLNILEKIGLESIEALGQEFDPELHDAMLHIESDEAESNSVLEEVSKGYKFKNKIIRHTKVVVSK